LSVPIAHKSKKRIRDHGEVFTHEKEVNAMLDLVKRETERIDSRFLEPACGTGNFLYEILRRKLEIVKQRYRKSQFEYEKYAIIAVSSIYGVDLLEDNVQECVDRLYKLFDEEYARLYKNKCKASCRNSVSFILSKNIIQGDALTLKTPDESKAIVFSEWNIAKDNLVKRRDYTLANLLENALPEPGSLFEILGENAFIPRPIADYPLTHFLKIGEP
jgi:hypothetical protein